MTKYEKNIMKRMFFVCSIFCIIEIAPQWIIADCTTISADTRTYGMHTITSLPIVGVDFEKGVVCSLEIQGCTGDFAWRWMGDGHFYSAFQLDSKFKSLGKINLDSVETGTLDSTEETNNVGAMFQLRQDSLDNYVGNVWVVLLGKGDRGHANWLKYKVLDFDVLDSVTHRATMTFLWVCNIGGAANLTSPVPLDTFTDLTIFDRYDGVGVSGERTREESLRKCKTREAYIRIKMASQVFNKLDRRMARSAKMVVTDHISLSIWDLNGKFLSKVLEGM
jgi:hypothetical protein